MKEQIVNLVQEYWWAIAAAVGLFAFPEKAVAAFSKIAIRKPAGKVPDNASEPDSVDDLDLVNQIARVNRDKGYGADEEIQAIFKKFSTGAK